MLLENDTTTTSDIGNEEMLSSESEQQSSFSGIRPNTNSLFVDDITNDMFSTSERPVLVILDGHSTHLQVNVVELAVENRVTILELPPHSTDILQPLDLAVLKSLIDAWDEQLVKWSRQNVGVKIQKKTFSKYVGQCWKDEAVQTIQSGFR